MSTYKLHIKQHPNKSKDLKIRQTIAVWSLVTRRACLYLRLLIRSAIIYIPLHLFNSLLGILAHPLSRYLFRSLHCSLFLYFYMSPYF